MLIRRFMLCCAVMVCLFLGGKIGATTDCVQTLDLLGVTGTGADGPYVFWVAEDLAGECCESRLIQVVVQKEQAGLIQSSLKGFQDWGCLKEAVALMEGPKGLSLKKEDTCWQDEHAQVRLADPAPNEVLFKRYRKEVATWCSSAREWNNHMGIEGISCPSIEGMNLELLYAYSRGLYINYSIKRVYYYPDRALLFVQTEQKERAVGMDTMHGFLVLRVWSKTDRPEDVTSD